MAEVTIQSIARLNHNVFQYETDKPPGFEFEPGQATEVAILKDGWKDKKRPFTFTSLRDGDYLMFTIKSYPDHGGVTEKLSHLSVGDRLEIGEAWGTISYKGPGTFIAGGAGLTPFLGILRNLAADRNNTDANTLYFANKSERDIFCRDELDTMPRLTVHHVLSQEDKPPHLHGRIDKDFLDKNIADFGGRFYVCGPDRMVKDISEAIRALGGDPDSITFED
jgi:ferredoxin-NADP reductase